MALLRKIPWWVYVIVLVIGGGALSALQSTAGSSGGPQNSLLESLNPQFSLPSFDTSINQIVMPSILPVIGGNSYPDIVVFFALLFLFVGLTIGAGLPIAILFRMLDGVATKNKQDEKVKAAQAEWDKQSKAYVKELVKEKPPTPMPSHERPGWSAASTTMIAMMLLAFVGAAFSDNFVGGENQFMWSVGFALIGLLIGLVAFRPNTMARVDSEDGFALDWGNVFIVVSGLVVLGLGFGVMMWVRSGGA